MEAVDVAEDVDVHVGTPPPASPGPLQNWATRKVHFHRLLRKVHFHGFAGLSTTHGTKVMSPEFSCFGHQWKVVIYPGGEGRSQEGFVAVYLVNRSQESIQVFYQIIMKHPTDLTQRTFRAQSNGEVTTIRVRGIRAFRE